MYVNEVWIFPFLPRLIHLGGLKAAVQDSISHALALPCLTFNDFSISILISFFQGVEPVDYGPGSNRQQGPETRICSPALVPGMQGIS